jgi:hypothetical protein
MSFRPVFERFLLFIIEPNTRFFYNRGAGQPLLV